MARFARHYSTLQKPRKPPIKINLTRKTPENHNINTLHSPKTPETPNKNKPHTQNPRRGVWGNLGSPKKLKKISINNERHPNIFI